MKLDSDNMTPEEMERKIKEAMVKAAEFAKFLEDPIINKSVGLMLRSEYKAGVRAGLLIGVIGTALVALLAVSI